MSKTIKTVLILIAIVAVVAGTVVFVVSKINSGKYIMKSDAIEIAIADSGLNRTEIIKAEADFEKTEYAAWYEVEIESHTNEYEYDIDAVTGKILSSVKGMRD